MADEAFEATLRRVINVWDLSAAEAASTAASNETLDDLEAATELLLRYLKPDRIPAAVRRKSENLDGKSLVELTTSEDGHRVLEACRAMFDFSETQA